MKIKFLIPLILSAIVLAACGQSQLDEPITLVTHDNEEIAFPTGEPVAFFFITSYT